MFCHNVLEEGDALPVPKTMIDRLEIISFRLPVVCLTDLTGEKRVRICLKPQFYFAIISKFKYASVFRSGKKTVHFGLPVLVY